MITANFKTFFRWRMQSIFIGALFVLGDENLPGGWENGQGTQGAHCMWPWIGGGETTIAIINCLKIQPTWMEENAWVFN